MPEQMNWEEVLKLNPQIDAEELERTREAFIENGALRRGYRLALPYSGHRVSVRDDDAQTDPRRVQLRRFP